MSEYHETTEWGVMELSPKNHGNTLPQNRKRAGSVIPCDSREDAESIAETRARFRPSQPVAVVSRTVMVGPWATSDAKVGV